MCHWERKHLSPWPFLALLTQLSNVPYIPQFGRQSYESGVSLCGAKDRHVPEHGKLTRGTKALKFRICWRTRSQRSGARPDDRLPRSESPDSTPTLDVGRRERVLCSPHSCLTTTVLQSSLHSLLGASVQALCKIRYPDRTRRLSGKLPSQLILRECLPLAF